MTGIVGAAALDTPTMKRDEQPIDDTVVMEPPGPRESREPDDLGGEEPTVRQPRPDLTRPSIVA